MLMIKFFYCRLH